MTNLLVQLFIKDYKDINNPDVRKQYGVLGGSVGIACNLILFVSKFAAGIFTGAISVTADAFNNLSDAGSSIMTLAGFQMAGKPADKDHPFGHGRSEYITGLFVSIAILLMGFELFKTSAQKIFRPEPMKISILSAGILLLSILVKFWMAHFNRTLGEQIQSASMKATATDSLSDCIATSSVLAGLFISHILGCNLDGYIGVLVACFILFAGYSAAKDTISPLLGQKPDPELVKEVSRRIMSKEEIIGYHDMVVHNYGPGRVMISVHGEIPYPMDLMTAHDAIDSVETEIKQDLGCDISIHMDPVVTDDEETNQMRKKIRDIIHSISDSLSFHDFRLSKTPSVTSLFFDVVIPFGFEMTKEELTLRINEKLQQSCPDCRAFIEVDHMML